MNFSKKEILFLVAGVVLFVALRFPGVQIPFHQDEYKWAFIVDRHSVFFDPGRIPHPPLGTYIYVTAMSILGHPGLRIAPLAFSAINFILLFYVAKEIFDRRTAFWSVGLFTVAFYSFLASLTIDTDGAIMPVFFLLLALSYHKLKNANFQISGPNKKRNLFWLTGLLVSIIGGFLIKVSFILAIGALVVDFAFAKNIFRDRQNLIKFLGWLIWGAVALVLLLLAAGKIFPAFELSSSLQYWEHFANFSHRGWLQIFIQSIKAVIYSSPLLILPILFLDRKIFKRTGFFSAYIGLGLVFYILAFDFSIGALDRYLQFLVLPLSLIAGAVYNKFLNDGGEVKRIIKSPLFAVSGVASVLVFCFQFLPHSVPLLYPKTEWINRALSFKWNFLFPFMGGSGPLPFYMSFGFIALSWLVTTLFAVWAFKNRKLIPAITMAILLVGIVYNAVFAEEYMFGHINGSTTTLVHEATNFIAHNNEINKVIVYNDNGGAEIVRMDKYRKRLYVDPKFDESEKAVNLNKYKEYYLVVNIPRLDPKSIYARYLEGCRSIYHKKSGRIDAFVYDCHLAPDIKP